MKKGRPLINLQGKVIGRWTIITRAASNNYGLACNFLISRVGHIFNYCGCMCYIADNLKFLEQLYDKTH